MIKLPGKIPLATSSANLSKGPEHGQPGSNSIPVFL